MGIFSSNESNDRTMAKNKRTMSDQINLVGEGTTFEGTLRTENDVRASGRIVGTMHVDGRAIIAKSGGVEGEIIATNADIAGHVLKSTARIDGDIHTRQLVVEEGARFTGQCVMGDEATTADRASTSSDSDASSTTKKEKSKKEGSNTTASSPADTASSS